MKLANELVAMALVALMATPLHADVAPPPAPKDPVTITAEVGSDGQTQGPATTLALDQHVIIRLPGNAGTGYGWRLDNDPAPQLSSVESETSGAPKGIFGGKQFTSFEFSADRAGEKELTFSYTGPASQVAKTYSISITVQD